MTHAFCSRGLEGSAQGHPRLALHEPNFDAKEYALDTLSPREIQFRVRAGESPEMVAADTGWQIDRVIRYAEPPLGERAYVAERAQGTYVHSTRGGSTLAEIVLNTTRASSLSWDSYYRNNQWVVSATMDGTTALWNFEPTGNTVHPLNDVARAWMGVEPVRIVEKQPSSNDTVIIEATEPVRLVAVPELDSDSEEMSQSATDENDTLLVDTELPLDVGPTKEVPAKKAKRGRAKVPSWDEILFGGPKETS